VIYRSSVKISEENRGALGMGIGIASYGALRHVPPLDFNFSGHFRSLLTLWLPTHKKYTGL